MPSMFFDLLLYCASQTEPCTLEQGCTWLKQTYGLEIKKQSLDERFSLDAVTFAKEVLKEALERQLNTVFESRFLPQFKRIPIKDGTRFNLSANLYKYYKGSGGSEGTSNSALCIQFEYDALCGKIITMEITDGTRNDQTDAKETVSRVEMGDLIIRDLGYYSLPTLSKFDSAGAFFISRLGASTLIYEPGKEKEISFAKLYNDMSKKKKAYVEIDIIAGKKERIPLRLIASIVPEEIYQKRLRKAEKNNKERGYNTSDDYKARCRFNLFITNIGSDILSAEDILTLYRIRWQIELMFKNWKSVFKIDEIQKMKYERFTCVLVAKLILIVVNLQIIWNIKKHYYAKVKKILSMYKCFKTLVKEFEIVYRILKKKREESKENLQNIVELFSANHWKEKRKNSVNYEDILDLFICKSI
jgi:hypothetical protein